MVTGGTLALVFAIGFPMVSRLAAIALYAAGGGVMTAVARVVGFRPVFMAALIATFIVALGDPALSWENGRTGLVLAEAAITFVVFTLAALVGSRLRLRAQRTR